MNEQKRKRMMRIICWILAGVLTLSVVGSVLLMMLV